MAKLDSRGLRFRGWFARPFLGYWPDKRDFYVFDNREDALQMIKEAFPNESSFIVQEVNYFEAHMEVDLGIAAIVTRIYNNRYFKFDIYEGSV